MADELEPCPICEGEAFVNTTVAGRIGESSQVICKKCGLRTPCYGSTECVVKLWNTRPDARAAYLKALDDVTKRFAIEVECVANSCGSYDNSSFTASDVIEIVHQLKSAYKEGGEK